MATTKKPGPKPKRKVSKLTQAGDEASRSARRVVLLTACDACRWNLTRVAETLELATASDVIRALKELAPDEYETAQTDGLVAKRRDSED